MRVTLRRYARAVAVTSVLTLLLLVPAAMARAQQITGTVQGVAADTSGAVLPGTTLELKNVETGLTTVQVSGGDGAFVFNAVKPGTYQVTATLEGFKTVSLTVEVDVNATATANVTMQVGGVSEIVVVEGRSASVELVKAQVAANIDAKTIVDLPNINRDITTLVEMMPGGRQVQGSTAGGSQVVDITGNYALGNGTRRSQSMFYLDGSENMGSRRNQGLQMPNPDTIEQVQIVTSSASAEFGKEPGISMNAITKSGTNILHGTGFIAAHNAALNANSWSGNRAGSPKPDDLQKWMGTTLGGPIRANRTFYFGSFQRYMDNQAVQQSTARMPTAAMMNGDFSAIPGFSIKALDPVTGRAIGSVIPASLINPLAAKLKGRFPTIDAYNNVLRYFWSTNRDVHNNEVLVKIDHKISDGNQLAVTYMTTKGAQVRPDGFPGLENQIPGWGGVGLSDAQQHTASLRHLWLPKSNLVVESRFAFGYLKSGRTRTELGENLGTLGSPWPTVTQGVEQTLPSIFFSGGPSGRGGQLSDTRQQNQRVLSTVNWVTGSHNVKFGAEAQISGFSRLLNYDNGQLFFTGAYSNTSGPVNGPWPSVSTPSGDNQFAYAWADFLLGRASRAVATGVSDDDMKGPAYFFFLQDEWRVNPRLTVTPGLRYELYGRQTSKALLAGYMDGHKSDLYPNAPLGLAFEGDSGVPLGFRDPDRNNIAPRLGLAWDILGDGRLALRTGGGLYYAYQPLAQLEILSGTIGATTITANNTNISDPWGAARANSGDTVCQFPGCVAPSFSSDPSKRTFTPVSINGFAPGFATPYQVQFNATMNWQATKHLMLEGAYVGNRTSNEFIVQDTNLAAWTAAANEGNVNARRPNQLWRGINIISNGATEKYDAGQFSATFRRPGLYGRLTYTLQRTMATGKSEGQEVGVSNAASDWTDNPRNLDGELAPITARQRIRLFYAVDLPHVHQPVLDAIAGGWQISGNFSWNDGDRLNVTIGRDFNFDGFGGDRPDQVGTITYSGQTNADGSLSWISNSAFALPGAPSATNQYPFGTLPRNAVFGPSQWSSDMALTKLFPVAGRMKVQVRADAVNVFNHANWDNPVLDLSNSDFGVVRTKTNGGRTMQLQAKLIF